MTHTLHRRGTKESLSKDFVVIILPVAGVNDQNLLQKQRKFLDITTKHKPVNVGDRWLGNLYTKGVTLEKIYADPKPLPVAVYDNKAAVTAVLKELKEADLGLSVVVSGVFDEVFDAAKKAGLKPHSLNMSLGIWGKTKLLPKENDLGITTMCGHCMVTPQLVKYLRRQISVGKMKPGDAAKKIAGGCICGAFNPARATQLFRQ